MRILFTGGGSGGHFYPIIAVARELKHLAESERIIDLELYYMGPSPTADEKKLLDEEEIYHIKIFTGKMRRYASAENGMDAFRVLLGIVQALWNFFFLIPDTVFSKGGHGAFPAVVAAKIFRIPLVIHESDAVPGIVNLFARKFATRIGIAFTGAEQYFPKEKTALVGIPIRKHLLGGNKTQAKQFFNITSIDLPIIGFIGASQGAQKLNDAVIGVLRELTDKFEIIHQTGPKNFEEVREQAQVILEFSHKERHHPYGFFDEETLRQFYSACDLIISRAGASSIYEIAAWGKPVILLPLAAAAADHQRKNAYEYAAEGAAMIIEETNLTPHILLAEIEKIIGNPDLMRRMASASQKFARVDSAEIIAHEILKIAQHERIPSVYIEYQQYKKQQSKAIAPEWTPVALEEHGEPEPLKQAQISLGENLSTSPPERSELVRFITTNIGGLVRAEKQAKLFIMIIVIGMFSLSILILYNFSTALIFGPHKLTPEEIKQYKQYEQLMLRYTQ